MTTTFENLRFTRELENGETLKFSAIAQGEGETILCLHGFPDHALSYRYQLPAFSEAGYRAVAVTMRGYEPSSIPKNANIDDFALIRLAEDVIAWIDELGVEKVHLVGHDWGAAITYLVASMAPEKLYSATAMAVPHLGRFGQEGFKKHPIQLRYSWYMFFFQLRGISDYVVERNNFKFIHRLWKNWCPTWNVPKKDVNLVVDTLSQTGVKKSALSYYRAMFNLASEANRETGRQARKKIDVPTLAITGVDDGCIHTDVFKSCMKQEDFEKELRVEQIQGAGHFLHQEKPEEINQLLLEWFKQYS
jgi:pimeloyl-ACP methyl ester carboxylesterase